MNALVYRIGGLGDSLLIYPVIEILTKKGYEVTVWGNPEYFKLAQVAGFCRQAIFYRPQKDFNKKIIFSKNTEIFDYAKNNNLIHIDPIPKEKIWIVDYYLKALGFEKEGFSKKLKFNFSFEKCDNLCVVHPGSGSRKKNPEINFFFELEEFLKNFGFKVLYLIGPAEKELTKIFQKSFYTEKTTEMAKTLIRASIYIGFDSGVSHLSSYLGVPSIVIFGPTEPAVWHPIGEKIWIIRDKSCSPCFPNVCGEKKCLQTDFLLDKILPILKSWLSDKNID